MSTRVHAQATSTTTKTVAFGSVFAGVAVLAVQFGLVLSAVGGVQHFTTKALENSIQLIKCIPIGKLKK